MSEEENKELQEAVGGEANSEAANEPAGSGQVPAGQEAEEATTEPTSSAPEAGEPEAAEASEEEPAGEADMENEIDASNAEDAEDSENERRHHIPFLDYHALSMENLVGELQRLLRTEKVQAIRRHAEAIKTEFDLKFQDFLEHKKEEFIDRGGNEADFRYNSVTKRQFNELYAEYREKRNQYYRSLDQQLKENLENRLAIIEQLKSLVNVEEDMNSTYKTFKDLQEAWRNAGPIPRTRYNDVWRTYHHHVEIFYDFLHLNRELRDLDFKHNLEEKEKLVARAEALANEPDLNKAFRELQTLHKVWKEELGPVAKEERQAIWDRFSAATKAMHQRRQDYHKVQEERYEANLAAKQEIISKIEAEAGQVADNHRGIQAQIKTVEALREAFFQAGKVPQKDNEPTWAAFKEAVRRFNRTKNAFYKNLKKEQQLHLDQKRALLQRAQELKDSEDWDTATPEMKRIQQEWKQIGHVPRKYSDKIWKQFKEACNHYFDRLHARRDSAHAGERENLKAKTDILDQLKAFQLSGKKEEDLEAVRGFLAAWKGQGRIPNNKKHLNAKFYKIVEALLRKMGIDRAEAEIIKYGDKIKQLAQADDLGAVEDERQFIRKKIEEYKNDIRQLENNLEFFSGSTEGNPLVQEVVNNIARKKEALQSWKAKLKKLNILRHHLERGPEEAESAEEPEEE
ncbi:DUF349 domain-containing protein [Robiginitalea sp. M366]|uniref:DUF349 domain-containing protein n=1 Tax=Robiginitalea aestuariiviva TaxID=3036903 RepID=UPI00240D4C3F|nr:DUF349 domain-containing protein [Robiginitalea aestuariiviva]MDG1573217.1 DUF349 domain-containing protein [Robiginitalea aestuariiviva]